MDCAHHALGLFLPHRIAASLRFVAASTDNSASFAVMARIIAHLCAQRGRSCLHSAHWHMDYLYLCRTLHTIALARVYRCAYSAWFASWVADAARTSFCTHSAGCHHASDIATSAAAHTAGRTPRRLFSIMRAARAPRACAPGALGYPRGTFRHQQRAAHSCASTRVNAHMGCTRICARAFKRHVLRSRLGRIARALPSWRARFYLQHSQQHCSCAHHSRGTPLRHTARNNRARACADGTRSMA